MRTFSELSRAVRGRLKPGPPGGPHRARRHDQADGNDESGAVLILALVFLVTVSVIVGALTDWVSNDLMNSRSFNATQSLNNSATNAVTLGVQSIRYTPLLYSQAGGTTTDVSLNASPPSYCWGSGPSQFTDPNASAPTTYNMNVYCSTVWNPTSAATRKVTVSACRVPAQDAPGTPQYVASWTAGRATCAANPLLQAIVTFDDYPPSGVSGPSQAQCVTYCGSTLTVNSWNWTPTVPVVTNVAGLSGALTSFDGGQPLTITGTGFTSGSTVNFVDADPLAQKITTTQQIVPATIVGTPTATTITATSPAVTTLANYYITVTNPSGQTSAVMPNASCTAPLVGCFSYTPIAPTVSSVSPTNGYTTHSTAITIKGSGFVYAPDGTPPTVTMVQDISGSPNTATQGNATAVQVVNNTTITALTYPFTTVGQAFFVTVTTSTGGASPYTTSAVYTFTTAPA